MNPIGCPPKLKAGAAGCIELAVVVAVLVLPKLSPVGAAGAVVVAGPKLKKPPVCPVLAPRLNPACAVEFPKLNPPLVVVGFVSVFPKEKPVVAVVVVVVAAAFPNVNPPAPKDCVVLPNICFGAAAPNENPDKGVACAPNAEAAVVPEEVVLDKLNKPVDGVVAGVEGVVPKEKPTALPAAGVLKENPDVPVVVVAVVVFGLKLNPPPEVAL